jgi:hypothetical protein
LINPSATPVGSDVPTWADQLEAISTLVGAIMAFAAAVATFWLLVHQIRETRRARADAQGERIDAAADRELARQDREIASAERRDAEKAQARTIIIRGVHAELVREAEGDWYVVRAQSTLENFGIQPVLDVFFMFGDVAQPGVGLDEVETVKRIAVLGPGERLQIDWTEPDLPTLTSPDFLHRKLEGTAPPTRLRVTAAFTDVAGRRWLRTNNDQPQLDLELHDDF